MRNICFLLVPDFDQHSKIEFRKLCLYLYLSQGGVLRDGKMGLMKDLVVFGLRFFLSEVIPYHKYIICFRQTKAHQAHYYMYLYQHQVSKSTLMRFLLKL